MANLSIKDLPDHAHKRLKKTAEKQGQSLNGYIVHVLELDAQERARKERMWKRRDELRRFVATLPHTGNLSAKLLREDRDTGH